MPNNTRQDTWPPEWLDWEQDQYETLATSFSPARKPFAYINIRHEVSMRYALEQICQSMARIRKEAEDRDPGPKAA